MKNIWLQTLLQYYGQGWLCPVSLGIVSHFFLLLKIKAQCSENKASSRSRAVACCINHQAAGPQCNLYKTLFAFNLHYIQNSGCYKLFTNSESSQSTVGVELDLACSGTRDAPVRQRV